MLKLLLGWSLGLSVLSAAAIWLNLQWQNDRQIRLRSHTQQDMRALMDTLIHDLRRANFQALMPNNIPGNSGACPSAFCGLPEDFELSSHQILFSVDRNSNGIKDNNECSGFRAKNLQILSLDFLVECDNKPAASGDVVAVSLRAQSISEKVPQTWQRWVRLRNHNARNRSETFNCNVGHS